MNKICNISDILHFMNKKWMMIILKTMSEDCETFNCIKHSIEGINQKILCTRLLELEERGFIVREIVQEKPIKIRYTLTQKGHSFCENISGLVDWQNTWK